MYAIYAFFGFWRPVTLTFDLFNWKLAFHLLVSCETFIPILIFLCVLFAFDVRAGQTGAWTDGRTDGRTDGGARRVMRSLGRPHNNVRRNRIYRSVFHSFKTVMMMAMMMMMMMMMRNCRRTSHTVTLPASLTTCINCTIRLRRQALEWGPNYIFWSCADVNVVPRKS